MSEKERIVKAMQDLPEDATVRDAINRLEFLEKILAGIRDADAGRLIPHEEVKKRFLG